MCRRGLLPLFGSAGHTAVSEMDKFLEEQLKKSRLFKGIPEQDVDRILSAAFPVHHTCQPGEVLVEAGDVSDRFGIVLRGVLTAGRPLTTGEDHLIDLYEQGDYFGLENAATRGKQSPVRITALERTDIVSFYLDHLLIGICEEAIKDNIISILANNNIRKLYKIDILSRAGLRERVLTYLQLLASKEGAATFRIGMTQEYLAKYLSVNRSALSKELNDMRREGLIDFKHDQFTLKGSH